MAKSLRQSLRQSKAKKLSFRSTSSWRKLRSSMRSSDVKRQTRRSPKRPQRKLKTSPKTGSKKSLGISRRIKLIDASPGTKSKKVGGTLVFLAKDSARKSGTRTPKSAAISRPKAVRMEPRFMNHSKAREGVDFFCNLGLRVLQAKPEDQQKRLRDGKGGGLIKGMVGGRLDAGRLEAGRSEAGRLQAGGMGAVNRMKVGAKRCIDLTEVPRGTELTRAVGLGSLCPSPVLNSSASMSAKDVVVPLTNRLPIIDFISTNEFNKMNESQKSSRRGNR
ncbi:hypothetical protein KR054_001054 [Drosophila jambulina]|nr:hypothetical protein KR054_001054 [Drosophila jambulina]